MYHISIVIYLRNRHLQYEAALAADAASVIIRGLTRLYMNNPTAFKHSLKDGKMHNNDTERQGIDCDAEPVTPWIHGNELMKLLREVRKQGT